jgi:hypothetical protein
MRLFRWLGVGCVATAGLVLAFAAGVWVTRPGEPAVTEQAKQPAPPTAKRVTPNTEKPPESLLPSVKPAPPVRPASDVPKAEPLPVVPLPAPIPMPEVKVAPLVLPDLPASSLPRAVEPVAPITPVQGVTGVVPVPAYPDGTRMPVRYVNKPELEFDYSLSKQGKSGVKSVSLFVRDPKGEKLDSPLKDLTQPTMEWREFATAEATAPKLRYSIPKDGRYEFRLGVTSGNGNVSRPKETDPPDLVVVYDTTRPKLEALAATVVANSNHPGGAAVDIRCGITDANLDGKVPVVRYVSAEKAKVLPEAAFQSDGKGDLSALPLTAERWQTAEVVWSKTTPDRGSWVVPDDAPTEVVLAVSATDKAGNTVVRLLPVLNLDTTIPEGKLTKVRAVDPPKEGKKIEPSIPPADPFAPLPKLTDEKK